MALSDASSALTKPVFTHALPPCLQRCCPAQPHALQTDMVCVEAVAARLRIAACGSQHTPPFPFVAGSCRGKSDLAGFQRTCKLTTPWQVNLVVAGLSLAFAKRQQTRGRSSHRGPAGHSALWHPVVTCDPGTVPGSHVTTGCHKARHTSHITLL